MLNFKGTFAGVVLMGMALTSQVTLAADDVFKAKLNGFEYSNPVDVKYSTNSGRNWTTADAGAYSGTWLNGESFAAFCVEVTQYAAPFGQWASYTEGSFSASVAGNLTNLANKYYSFVDNSVSSAAFQVAVWEIVSESRNALNLDKGTFQVDNTTDKVKYGWLGYKYEDNPESVAAIELAQSWLSGLNDDSVAATGNYSLQLLQNKHKQDLLVLSPIAAVPEPATYGMLLLGIGMVALFARRRSTVTAIRA